VLDDGREVHSGAGEGDGFEEVGGEDGLGLGAQERRPALCGPVGCRVGFGVVKDLPADGGGDVDAWDEWFAVDAAVPPGLFSRARRRTRVRMDRTGRGRPTRLGREIRA
jgi:hypothetical protein